MSFNKDYWLSYNQLDITGCDNKIQCKIEEIETIKNEIDELEVKRLGYQTLRNLIVDKEVTIQAMTVYEKIKHYLKSTLDGLHLTYTIRGYNWNTRRDEEIEEPNQCCTVTIKLHNNIDDKKIDSIEKNNAIRFQLKEEQEKQVILNTTNTVVNENRQPVFTMMMNVSSGRDSYTQNNRVGLGLGVVLK